MLEQHSRSDQFRQAEEAGISVPLTLPGLRIVAQRRTAAGKLAVTVIGAQTRAP
jgi:hypothetical protein